MHRRTFLSVAGLAGLSGCSASDLLPTSTPTENPTPEATTTVETPPETTTTAETTEEPPTETTTETGTPTLAEARLQRARGQLQSAIDAYAEQGTLDGDGLLRVDARATEFSSGAVFEHTNRARERIRGADELDQGELADEIRTLEEVHQFLTRAAQTQQYLGNAYANLETILQRIESENYTNADQFRRSMASNVANAREALEALRKTTSADAIGDFEGLSADGYAAKIEEFSNELGAFQTIDEALVEFISALKGFSEEWSEYYDDDDNYGAFSPEQFEPISAKMSQSPSPDSMTELIDELNCLIDSRAKASGHMQSAASAREDGERVLAREYEQMAEDEMNRCTV